jgi:hypothetical protein
VFVNGLQCGDGATLNAERGRHRIASIAEEFGLDGQALRVELVVGLLAWAGRHALIMRLTADTVKGELECQFVGNN